MRLAIVLFACSSMLLSGCGITPPASSTAEAGLMLQGVVHGGQQPVVGAHVYLFAANTTGYGNASVSLLKAASTLNSDAIGAYVLTDSRGSFSIANDYACTPNTQVYVYALGGNPGAGTNAAAGFLSVLGNCPSAGNFAGVTPYIWVNEVSTVAAAYAIAGFATDATHVSSSGTALAQIGIANAFANAANLASLSTGAALAATPAGNGTAPQSEINTLANILANCVNSNGTLTGPTNATSCYTLFNNALSAGASGTVPTDTATAAMNIAHNPGVNVHALYGLSAPALTFAPALSAQPNDYTVSINFTGGGLNASDAIAIDGYGNAWVANYLSVSEFSSTGVALSPSAGYTGGGVAVPVAIAVDPVGNVWLTNNELLSGELVPGISEFSGQTGAPISSSMGYPSKQLSLPSGIGIDGSGNVWQADQTNTGALTEFSSAGTVLSPAPFGYSEYTSANHSPEWLALDGHGNVWVANSDGNVQEFSNAGTLLSGAGYSQSVAVGPIAIDNAGNIWISGSTQMAEISPKGAILSGTGFSGAGTNQAGGIGVDGAGNLWTVGYSLYFNGITYVPGASTIAEYTNAGVAVSPSAGYTPPSLYEPFGLSLALDQSGNVWICNSGNGTITELLGAAVPVVVPLSVGVKNNTLGTRP